MALEKNTIVNFNRNDSVKQNATIVSFNGNNIANIPTIIIEFATGWNPDAKRVQSFSLDTNKKYLFVSTSELTLAT